MSIDDNTKLEVSYDHYKESFLYIREREKQRDQLFFILVVLLGLIVLEFRYSVVIPAAISELNLVGFKVKISQVPIPVLLSTTWAFLAGILLRYYQVTLDVEKKFSYLHSIENQISKSMGEEKIISRESSAYLTEKGKWFRHWTWAFYTAAFPIIVLAVVGCMMGAELKSTEIPLGHKVFDCVLAGFSLISVLLYLYGVWFKGRKNG